MQATTIVDPRPSLGRNRRTEEAYRRLTDDILEGRLDPGQQLLETSLALQYGTSRTPVREALQILISEGLATATSTGIVVAQLTVREVEGLLETSQALQVLACRLAAARGTEEQMAQLEQIMVRMETAAASNDLPGFVAADKELHVQVSCMADNGSLSRMVRQMESLIGRIRHLAIRLPGRMVESGVEHRRVVKAIKERDVDLAEQAIRDHLKTVDALLLHVLENFVVPLKGQHF